MVLAVYAPVVAMAAGDFKPCCWEGASPWTSEFKDTFKSNNLAGYQGSELPPSTGYNLDHLDKYANPAQNNLYQREGPGKSESNPQRNGGDRGELAEAVQGIARP